MQTAPLFRSGIHDKDTYKITGRGFTVEYLRAVVRAFGSPGEEFLVPQGGRRLPTLVSLLDDLSDFFDKECLGGDPYSRTFQGAPGYDNVVVDRDLSKAEELRPYRALDPSRLILYGNALWDPSPYLSDRLWIAYQEPATLLWTLDETEDSPDLEKERLDHTCELALVWDARGLLFLRNQPIEEDNMHLSMRFFNNYKNPTTDRMIGDRRARNYVEGRLVSASRRLPSAQCLLDLEISPGCQRLSICASDRRDFYHQMKVSEQRAASNAVFPLVTLSAIEGTAAFKSWVLRNHRGQRYDRTKHGDFLLAQESQKRKGKDIPPFFQICINSVPQGDHLGVEFATEAHRAFLLQKGLFPGQCELQSGRCFRGSDVASGLVIDDFYCISVEDDNLPVYDPDGAAYQDLSRATMHMKRATAAYKAEGLLGSPDKDLWDSQKAKVTGAEIDASPETRARGLTSVGSPATKRLALSYVSMRLACARWTKCNALQEAHHVHLL